MKSLEGRYVTLARIANHLGILTHAEHWRQARAKWMALARQERGSAQIWAMGLAVVLLGAPAVVLDLEREGVQERMDAQVPPAHNIFTDVPGSFDAPVPAGGEILFEPETLFEAEDNDGE